MKSYRSAHALVRGVVGALCVLLILGQPVYAGKLDDFEAEATDDDHRHHPAQDDDDDDDTLFGTILRGIFRVLFWDDDDDDKHPHAENHARVRPQSRRNSYYPPAYNPMLRPYLRFDSAYQNVQSDVHAWDFRAEGGYEFVGVQGRLTAYREESPNDVLWLLYVHGLLRLSLGEYAAIEPGAGAIILVGNNENAGFSFTLPVLIYPQEALGFEFRPTWSWIDENPIHDYDLGLTLGGKKLAFRAGYRWTSTDDESLDGVYFGLTSRF